MDLRYGLMRERYLTLAYYVQGMEGGKMMDGAKDFITNEKRLCLRSKL